LEKCWAYILEYEWRKGKRSMVNTAELYKDITVDQSFQKKSDKINLLNPNVARIMLGVYTAPDGNTKTQFKVLHDKLSKNMGS